jgi:hypothetical protein
MRGCELSAVAEFRAGGFQRMEGGLEDKENSQTLCLSVDI